MVVEGRNFLWGLGMLTRVQRHLSIGWFAYTLPSSLRSPGIIPGPDRRHFCNVKSMMAIYDYTILKKTCVYSGARMGLIGRTSGRGQI